MLTKSLVAALGISHPFNKGENTDLLIILQTLYLSIIFANEAEIHLNPFRLALLLKIRVKEKETEYLNLVMDNQII